MSFNVVIKGPEATAGSIFKRSINRGIIAPDKVATVKVVSKAIPTKIPKNTLPFHI